MLHALLPGIIIHSHAMKKDVVHKIEHTIKTRWNHLGLTDFGGEELAYKDVARRIVKLHLLFEAAGIEPGDKIAVCGKNSAQWVIAFLASMTYGAVTVPILHEFKPESLSHLVKHSDSKLFFVDKAIFDQLAEADLDTLIGVFDLKDFSLLKSADDALTQARSQLNLLFGKRYPDRFTPEEIHYYEVTDPDSLAVINYTSGSTGFSKGVMLPHRALWSNVHAIQDILHDLPKAGDSMICMLPMAHMYGMVIEMVHAVCKGCHLYFLTRQPSPKVLLEAFRTARPRLIITVPLIIEKIIKTKVFPTLDRPMTRLLLKTPFVDRKILEKVRGALMDTFGGNLEMMIVGGAGLNREVEQFLMRINFPITVGYGMTECAPLIGYTHHTTFRPGCCGEVVPRMTVKADSPDPRHIPGELMVKGDNVMLGYYKNPEATNAAFTPDGWMRTGDLGTIDPDGFIYIRGRNKTMILGPSGQNIYPEELEQKINNLPLVGESLVVDSGEGKLRALIYPDPEEVKELGLLPQEVKTRLQSEIDTLNPTLEAYQRIASIRVMDEEFEKTPKRSIKRYLYV